MKIIGFKTLVLSCLLSGCSSLPMEKEQEDPSCTLSHDGKIAIQASSATVAGAGAGAIALGLFDVSQWFGLIGAITVTPVVSVGVGVGTWYLIDALIDDCEE